jgi:hypothetical protein
LGTPKEISLSQLDEAFSIQKKNIIDMAITFSAMNRVFEHGSKQKIAVNLERSLGFLINIDDKAIFEEIHADFCERFIQNISTAERVLKNNRIKRSRAASYGQAAKVFDVALKVYVYYCNLPDSVSVSKLLPMLHSAVDTLMMKNLKMKYLEENVKAKTIEAVGKSDYVVLQKMVKKHIEDEFENKILPVHYDDIMWYRLNKRP